MRIKRSFLRGSLALLEILKGSLGRSARRLQRHVLLALLAAVAVLPDVSAAEKPEVVRIASVAYSRDGKVVYTGNTAIISQQGWLAEELGRLGIRLEWYPAMTATVGATINEAFANGSIDFASYGDLPSIIVNSAGVQTRVIVPNGRGSDTYLVVPAASGAKTIADLKGKRIAIHRGRPWELPFIRLLEANGLSYADFRIFNINPDAGAAALAAGSVDALYTLTDAFQLEDKGVGRIIWSTRNAPPDWKMRAELWGSKAFIDKYPDVAQLVATAYVKAAHWSAQQENREAIIDVATRTGVPRTSIIREYDDDLTPWKDRWSPLFDQYVLTHYEHAVKYALEKKIIRRPVEPQDLLAPQFVEQALRQLGLESYWQPGTATAGNGSP